MVDWDDFVIGGSAEKGQGTWEPNFHALWRGEGGDLKRLRFLKSAGFL